MAAVEERRREVRKRLETMDDRGRKKDRRLFRSDERSGRRADEAREQRSSPWTGGDPEDQRAGVCEKGQKDTSSQRRCELSIPA